MIDYRNNGFQNKGGDLDITNKCTLQCPTCSRGKFNYKSNDIPGGDLTFEESGKDQDGRPWTIKKGHSFCY